MMPSTRDSRVALPERYRVVRHIANGGMASVWAAEDELLGRLVAVKVLSPALAADARARRRFMREARAAARVSAHPNVVTVYDVGEHEDRAFIVMEHFAGGTVANRMKAGRIPRELALDWLEDAASALDHAHECDIVHRDVKPGNLLLDGAGRLGVADFGIATLATESPLTVTGQVLGTAAYLSPEQALGRPATAASDRYALAVVAYELLTGRRPFRAQNVAAQARQHIEEPVPPATEAGLPAAADDVLNRGLAKDPERRPATASELVAELRAALDEPRFAPAEPPTTVIPPAAPPREGGGRRRAPALIALVALLLVAGIAAAIALSGGGGGDKPTSRTSTHANKKTKTKAKAKAKAKPKPKPKPAATQTQTAPQTQTQTQTTTTTPPAATDSRTLESQGHSLLAAGRVTEAIPVLQQAIRNCPVSTTDPCAYAYYDLGHALRLAGRPDEAIPILETRLQNPNQAGAVQAELDLARREAQGPAAGPGHGKAKGHGKR